MNNCYLRINRPSIQVRTLSQKLNTGGCSNNGNIPIIALNGNIIDTESFEKEYLNPLSVYSKTNFDNNSECSTEDGQKKMQLMEELNTDSKFWEDQMNFPVMFQQLFRMGHMHTIIMKEMVCTKSGR